MTKRILTLLGKLENYKLRCYNLWIDNGYSEELYKKLRLISKISLQLHEQKRGFLKSKIAYDKCAEWLINNMEKLSYQELHQGIMEIVFSKKHNK